MATKLERVMARREALSALGRNLARRARSNCELCEASGVRLDPLEVPPLPEEPELEHTVLICERCTAALDGGSMAAEEWRVLETVMWSEVPAVQVCAVRLLRALAEETPWAREALEGLYRDPEVEAWLAS